MKIAIIGGGISGCAVYLLLKKHLPPCNSGNDHSMTIYEAYDTKPCTTTGKQSQESSTIYSATLQVGGGLGIGPNGLGVLKRLDESLLRDIVRGGYVTGSMVIKSKHGNVLARSRSAGNADSSQNQARSMNMVATSRHSFWQCIRRRIPDSDIVAKEILRVVAKPEARNVISFVDGSPDSEVDMVIGADGLKSITRQALFQGKSEYSPIPQYEGLVGVGGFVSAYDVREYVEKGSMNFVFGNNGFFGYYFSESADSEPHRDSPYHISEPGDRLFWWSTYGISQCPNPKSIDTEDVTRQLLERHKSWGDPVIQRILNSLHVENMYPTWTVPPLDTWERYGVILVGDAAHALPPTSGQGSSQALEDSEALTLLLAYQMKQIYKPDTADVAELKALITKAAKQYIDLRMPRVTRILEESRKMQNHKRDMGVIQEHLMYGVMWLMGRFPSYVAKRMNYLFTYNVAQEILKITRA